MAYDQDIIRKNPFDFKLSDVIPITSHAFRHTFCTNMANAVMEVKTLQYLMGHSNVSVTLNVYTHSSYEHVKEQIEKVINLDVINFKLALKSESRFLLYLNFITPITTPFYNNIY